MAFSEEFLAMWQHIIDEVYKTEIPLECIKKVVIKLHGKKQRTINLQILRLQGLDGEELETILRRALSELGDQVRDVEFLVDITAVAELVQPETDKLLTNLK